ncbi:hypothetical protein PAXINDRAFT_178540 [Paxillus involutus ATCC 200175]|nr:hypothetical protein PAXINDRAFT_178540 [Paxillus involutus ATCC 200175]
MVVLSARFAVLACLFSLAAINLPPSVDAAYLQARHSEGKHVNRSLGTISEQQIDPAPTLPGDSDNKKARDPLHGLREFMQAQGRRDVGRPPLLSRGAVTRGHDHGQQAHENVYRSVFARRQHHPSHDSGARHHDHRSSVYVPDKQGNAYLVSRVQHSGSGNDAVAGKVKPTPHPRRQSQVLGTINIVSNGASQTLASLAADPSPINSTSAGQNNTKAFALNASTTNQTQFIMTLVDGPSGAAGGSDKPVALAMQVFDAASAEIVMYCATYDSNPGTPSALMMKPCTTPSMSDNDSTDSANAVAGAPISGVAIDNTVASNPQESQLFSFDPSSGQIQPISVGNSAVAYDSSNSTNSTNPSTAGTAKRYMARNNGNSTTSGNATPSSTSTSALPSSTSSQQVQNVTLIFVPESVEVPAPAPSPANAGAGQAAVFTTTVTTTVFATATSSASNNTQSVTPAQAAASLATSSEPCESTTSAVHSAQAAAVKTSSTSSTVPASVASSSSSSSSTTSVANKSLQIEIVAASSASASTPTPATATSTVTTSTATATTSTGTTRVSLNAEAVASSIANARSSTSTSSVTTTTASVSTASAPARRMFRRVY